MDFVRKSMKRGCTIYVSENKDADQLGVTAQLICTFVFAYENIRFYHHPHHQPSDIKLDIVFVTSVSQ